MLDTLAINYAVLPQRGEDSFAVLRLENGALLCVADGCGGLGSRRYHDLKDKTGAYMASRLAVRYMETWVKGHPMPPATPAEGRVLLDELEAGLHSMMTGFATRNGMMESAGRIVGSLQRILPSTLCAVRITEDGGHESCSFLWAGDSRGYVLDEGGLHQYTEDDLRTPMDPFEALSCDAPLSNCLSADQPIRLHLRRVSLARPCVVICATDGIFGCLPTPMEFEMLLLSTLHAAKDEKAWRRNLQSAVCKLASDDATLLCLPIGFDTFDELRAFFEPRLSTLKDNWILPVRLKGKDRLYAEQKWLDYREAYDCTEGAENSEDDWRI